MAFAPGYNSGGGSPQLGGGLASAFPRRQLPAGFTRPRRGMLGTQWLAQNRRQQAPGLPAGFTRPGTTGTNPGMLGTDWLARNQRGGIGSAYPQRPPTPSLAQQIGSQRELQSWLQKLQPNLAPYGRLQTGPSAYATARNQFEIDRARYGGGVPTPYVSQTLQEILNQTQPPATQQRPQPTWAPQRPPGAQPLQDFFNQMRPPAPAPTPPVAPTVPAPTTPTPTAPTPAAPAPTQTPRPTWAPPAAPATPAPAPPGSRMPAGFTRPGTTGSNPGMLGTDFLASIRQPQP